MVSDTAQKPKEKHKHHCLKWRVDPLFPQLKHCLSLTYILTCIVNPVLQIIILISQNKILCNGFTQ